MTPKGVDGNLMLRPWVHDLTPENPTDTIANTYSIKDFVRAKRCFGEVRIDLWDVAAIPCECGYL
jgi:hypothetical protein